MSILIWIAIGIAVYAITFKNDFDSENMEKAGVFSLAVCVILFIGGDDLQPISVRVGDKVDAHCGVLKTDAPHLFMLVVRCCEIVCAEGEMELIVPQIICMVPVTEPGQLKLVRRNAIPKVNNDKAAVIRVDTVYFGQTKRFPVKGKRTVKVADIEIIMGKRKLHNHIPPDNIVVVILYHVSAQNTIGLDDFCLHCRKVML